MKRLAILGASGHGKIVAEIAELTGWKEVIFYDDAFPDVKAVGHWSVEGATEDLIADAERFSAAIIAIGDNRIRLEKSKYLISKKLTLATLIHSSSAVSKYAKIGAGTVVMAGAVVNSFSSIGIGSIINTASSVDHDCVIGEGVHISPGVHVAGGVKVGDLSWLCIGSIVKQCINIGQSTIVGAGAVVLDDVSDGSMVKGIPARAR